MQIRRFYVNLSDIDGDMVVINNDEYSHICNVLRYKVGYEVIICANDGCERYGKVVEITPSVVIVKVHKVVEVAKRDFEIDLYCGLLNNNKLDYTIQKCTELGVNQIVPVLFHNCDEKKFNLERAQKISKEAAKQCKAVSIPEILDLHGYDEFINQLDKYENVVFAYENAKDGKINQQKLGMKIAIVIGPEGGFTEQEYKGISRFGESVTLGKRILRAETAATVATTLVLQNKGEL